MSGIINRLLILTLAIIVFSGALVPVFSNQASALSGSDFKAGRIIDDVIFYNSKSMSAIEIQAFLNAKVPVCDRNRASTNPSYQPPWTCLKEYQENTTTKENNIGRFNPDGSPYNIPGGKSAAQIIWDVGQKYGINPQVLIVMLQKEQSLITDNWPWKIQYDRAMGYACPDTAPCNELYYGFYNQVDSAAWQLKRYIQYPDNYNYKSGVSRYILYNPSVSCGGSNVFIENGATAALYNYTPYQPNAGALANLYGTAPCGAYGNRNFWRLFNEWFGSTLAPTYGSLPYSSGSSIPTGTMVQGDIARVVFKVQNMGNTPWSKSNTYLGTDGPKDRGSAFNYGWPTKNRAAQLKENTVASGEIGTFEFWYRAPGFNGTFTEKFSIVIEGATWIPYSGLFLTTKVTSPDYTAKIVSLGSYKDESLKLGKATDKMAPGEKAYVVVRVKNEGNRTWLKDGTNSSRLGTIGPFDRKSGFNYGWPSANRSAVMDQTSVAPGQIATYRFWYSAPNVFGSHTEKFSIAHEGRAWSNDFGFYLRTAIDNPQYSYQPVSSASSAPTDKMAPGDNAKVIFKVKNTGNITWNKANTRLGTADPIGRYSAFNDSWLTKNRPTLLKEESVAPGEIGTFEFWYRAPNLNGTFTEKFSIVIEGVTWVPYSGLYLTTTIN